MLFRKNYGKIYREQYLQKLGHFFATPVQAEHLLSLEATDAIMDKARTVQQQRQWVCMYPGDAQAHCPASTSRAQILAFYPDFEYADAHQMLVWAQAFLDRQACHLDWDGDSYCCGMYQTDGNTRINLDYDFSRHKPDDVWLYAADGHARFHLEYLHETVLRDLSTGARVDANVLECTYSLYED